MIHADRLANASLFARCRGIRRIQPNQQIAAFERARRASLLLCLCMAHCEYANVINKELERGVFLTTKASEKVNSMVIGWGHIGRIWERPVFIAFIRDSRYSREMLDANPEFTVNVPINGFNKKAFAVCGTKSGRDMDKITEAGLTLVDPEKISVPAIREFPLTLECRVIYRQEQNAASLPEEIRRQFYTIETEDHITYYGEIVDAYIIED